MEVQGDRSILTDPAGVGNWGPARGNLGQALPWGKEDYPALWIPGLAGQLSKARTQTRSAPLQATQRLCTHVFLFILNPPFGALPVLPRLLTAAPTQGWPGCPQEGKGSRAGGFLPGAGGSWAIGEGYSLAYSRLLPAGGRASPAATAPLSSARTSPSLAPSEPTGPGPGRGSL